MAEHRRPWRALSPDLFRFTTGDSYELHTALLTAFEEAAVLLPAMNLDQVRGALDDQGWDEALDEDGLRRSLHALKHWGLLDVSQDHAARYATPEEFERRNLQWSLTARGEAAVSGLLHALDSLRHATGLQPAVLDAIADGLADLADLLGSPPGADRTDARIATRLAEVEHHQSSLVASVRQFNGQLQRLLRDDGTDDAIFLEVKRRTVSYLEEYIQGVERPLQRISTGVQRLEQVGLPILFDRAAAGANLAPLFGEDQTPAWISERVRRWGALRAWFAPPAGEGARIDGLVDVARSAIVELLRALERRWDSRRRSASVANDFRRLAGWFAATPTEDDAHRLFLAAFGLWPARHAHLADLDGEAVASTTSWLAAPAVEVAPALRTSGSLAARGRVRPVPDPRALRAVRQRQQAEALAVHDALRASLLTEGALRLSAFAELTVDAFGELLALLAAGLEAPASADGTRRALSADGQVEVVLTDLGDGRTAALRTELGVLRGPDLVVTLHLANPERAEGTGA